MKILKIASLIGCAGALCGWPGFSQVPASSGSGAEPVGARVRSLIGFAVENHDGARLGVIKDFVVDFHTGRINYAIISAAGILGLRPQLTAVPPQALSPATVKQRTLALDIGKARWKDAPRFHKKDLQLLSERTWEVQIYQFYHLPVPGSKPPRGGPALPKGGLELASATIGWTVLNQQGEVLGRLSEWLLDLSDQRPAMAIVGLTGRPPGKATYAIPLRGLKLAGSGQLVVNATRGMFEQARMFTPKSWPPMAGSTVTVLRFE